MNECMNAWMRARCIGTYLVFLEDLAKSGDLSIHESAECSDVLAALLDLCVVLDEAPLSLSRQAAGIGASQHQPVHEAREVT